MSVELCATVRDLVLVLFHPSDEVIDGGREGPAEIGELVLDAGRHLRVTIGDSGRDDMPAQPTTDSDTSAPLAHPALDVRHDTFTIERRFDAAPAAVFAAFANEQTRRRWFRLPGQGASYRHEFRVGGGEDATSTFTIPDAAPERLAYHSHYLDIVQDRRIVFSYTSSVGDVPRWTALVTVLLADDETGCRLTWTEQVAFLTRTGDGSADFPHLRGGTTLRLNGLTAALPDGDGFPRRR